MKTQSCLSFVICAKGIGKILKVQSSVRIANGVKTVTFPISIILLCFAVSKTYFKLAHVIYILNVLHIM